MLLFLTPIFLIVLAFIGVWKNTNNLIFMLLYLELILISTTITFTLCSIFKVNYFTQCYSIYILTIAAVESAILITIVVQFFRNNNTINLNRVNI